MNAAEDLVLDGNALAGPLSSVFLADATAARATCAGCGAVRALAEARLFRGAGDTLRCVQCDRVLLRLVRAPGRVYLELTGIRCIELAVA